MNKFNFKSYIAGVLSCIIAMSVIVYAEPIEKTLKATFKDIKITVDGKEVVPKDANGNIIEPFVVDGSTYLPVRAVADAVGYDVAWDSNTNIVALKAKKATVEEKTAVKTEDVVLKTADDIEKYLTDNYSKISSSSHNLPRVKFRVYENEMMSTPYDYVIHILWAEYDSDYKGSSFYVEYSGIMSSIKYTDEEKEILKAEVKRYHENLAADLIKKLPNKKVSCMFYYRYDIQITKYRKEMYTATGYRWINYKSDKVSFDYKDNYISEFQWIELDTKITNLGEYYVNS